MKVESENIEPVIKDKSSNKNKFENLKNIYNLSFNKQELKNVNEYLENQDKVVNYKKPEIVEVTHAFSCNEIFPLAIIDVSALYPLSGDVFSNKTLSAILGDSIDKLNDYYKCGCNIPILAVPGVDFKISFHKIEGKLEDAKTLLYDLKEKNKTGEYTGTNNFDIELMNNIVHLVLIENKLFCYGYKNIQDTQQGDFFDVGTLKKMEKYLKKDIFQTPYSTQSESSQNTWEILKEEEDASIRKELLSYLNSKIFLPIGCPRIYANKNQNYTDYDSVSYNDKLKKIRGMEIFLPLNKELRCLLQEIPRDQGNSKMPTLLFQFPLYITKENSETGNELIKKKLRIAEIVYNELLAQGYIKSKSHPKGELDSTIYSFDYFLRGILKFFTDSGANQNSFSIKHHNVTNIIEDHEEQKWVQTAFERFIQLIYGKQCTFKEQSFELYYSLPIDILINVLLSYRENSKQKEFIKAFIKAAEAMMGYYFLSNDYNKILRLATTVLLFDYANKRANYFVCPGISDIESIQYMNMEKNLSNLSKMYDELKKRKSTQLPDTIKNQEDVISTVEDFVAAFITLYCRFKTLINNKERADFLLLTYYESTILPHEWKNIEKILSDWNLTSYPIVFKQKSMADSQQIYIYFHNIKSEKTTGTVIPLEKFIKNIENYIKKNGLTCSLNLNKFITELNDKLNDNKEKPSPLVYYDSSNHHYRTLPTLGVNFLGENCGNKELKKQNVEKFAALLHLYNSCGGNLDNLELDKLNKYDKKNYKILFPANNKELSNDKELSNNNISSTTYFKDDNTNLNIDCVVGVEYSGVETLIEKAKKIINKIKLIVIGKGETNNINENKTTNTTNISDDEKQMLLLKSMSTAAQHCADAFTLYSTKVLNKIISWRLLNTSIQTIQKIAEVPGKTNEKKNNKKIVEITKILIDQAEKLCKEIEKEFNEEDNAKIKRSEAYPSFLIQYMEILYYKNCNNNSKAIIDYCKTIQSWCKKYASRIESFNNQQFGFFESIDKKTLAQKKLQFFLDKLPIEIKCFISNENPKYTAPRNLDHCPQL